MKLWPTPPPHSLTSLFSFISSHEEEPAQGQSSAALHKPIAPMCPPCTTEIFNTECVCVRVWKSYLLLHPFLEIPSLQIWCWSLSGVPERKWQMFSPAELSSCLCFKGPNYLRSFPWPSTEEGYPHLISFTHQTSDSMERQERRVQRVEAQYRTWPTQSSQHWYNDNTSQRMALLSTELFSDGAIELKPGADF